MHSTHNFPHLLATVAQWVQLAVDAKENSLLWIKPTPTDGWIKVHRRLSKACMLPRTRGSISSADFPGHAGVIGLTSLLVTQETCCSSLVMHGALSCSRHCGEVPGWGRDQYPLGTENRASLFSVSSKVLLGQQGQRSVAGKAFLRELSSSSFAEQTTEAEWPQQL